MLGLESVPEIKENDDLAEIIIKCSDDEIDGIQEKDVIVLTSKIVSKALGRARKLSEVKPGKKVLAISKKTGKDAQWLQMIFDEGHQILAILPLKGLIERHIFNASEDNRCAEELIEHEQAVCITKGKDGKIHTCDAGIDGSNLPGDIVCLLPEDPNKTATDIRKKIQTLTRKKVAVIFADTEMIPFGTMDLALASAGIAPCSKMFGKIDNFGKPKFGGMDLVANELTCACALVFGQVNAGIPVAIIRGYDYEESETENIANAFIPDMDGNAAAKAVKAAIRATAHACPLKQRILLKIASWFM